jgi:endonuclease YncB( thermonuclease family)
MSEPPDRAGYSRHADTPTRRLSDRGLAYSRRVRKTAAVARIMPSLPTLLVVVAVAVAVTAAAAPGRPVTTYRVDHVVDGDTIDLTDGARVRLVQIDTPELYIAPEC